MMNGNGENRKRKRSRTILIVNNSPTERLAIARFLERHGYETVMTSNGKDLTWRIKELNVDLIILDLNLPGITGLEVLRSMDPDTRKPPVILISCYSEKEVELGTWKYQIDGFLSKPVDSDEFLESVKQQLRRNGRL